MNKATESYFCRPNDDNRFCDVWIVRPFSVQDGGIIVILTWLRRLKIFEFVCIHNSGLTSRNKLYGLNANRTAFQGGP